MKRLEDLWRNTKSMNGSSLSRTVYHSICADNSSSTQFVSADSFDLSRHEILHSSPLTITTNNTTSNNNQQLPDLLSLPSSPIPRSIIDAACEDNGMWTPSINNLSKANEDNNNASRLTDLDASPITDRIQTVISTTNIRITDNDELLNNLVNCLNSRPDLTCSTCGKQCISTSGLSRHRMLFHQDNQSEIYECQLCGSKFKLKNSLRRHMRKKHPNHEDHGIIDTQSMGDASLGSIEQASTTIDTCIITAGHQVNDAPAMDRNGINHIESTVTTVGGNCPHLSISLHSFDHGSSVGATSDMSEPNEHPNTTYECDICNKICKSKAGLTLHRKVHPGAPINEITTLVTSSKEFKCDYCDLSFDTLIGKQQHKRIKHANELNNERLLKLNQGRRKWSEQEDGLLLDLANELECKVDFKNKLYLLINHYLPNRSTESIKKRLQLLKWSSSISSSSRSSRSIENNHITSNLSSPSRRLEDTLNDGWDEEDNVCMNNCDEVDNNGNNCIDLTNTLSFPIDSIAGDSTNQCRNIDYDFQDLEQDHSEEDILSEELDQIASKTIVIQSPAGQDEEMLETTITMNQDITMAVDMDVSTMNNDMTLRLVMTSPNEAIEVCNNIMDNYEGANNDAIDTQPNQSIHHNLLLSEARHQPLNAHMPILNVSSPNNNKKGSNRDTDILYKVCDRISNQRLDSQSRDLIVEAKKLFSCVQNNVWDVERLLLLCDSILNNTLTDTEVKTILDDHARTNFPIRWKPSKTREIPPEGRINNKDRKRLRYAHMQFLYHNKPKDAATTVLNGNWRQAYRPAQNKLPNLYDSWEDTLNRPGGADEREIVDKADTINELTLPITVPEVRRSLLEMRGSAPGPDRITAYDLLKISTELICGYYNLLLAIGYVPIIMNTARTTLIPKTVNPEDPTDFRPITIASCILRTLHKILCVRWLPIFDKQGQQFAFLNRDGCFEATTVLHAIMRNAHENCSELSIASIDLSRAFDSVYHDTILRGAERYGATTMLMNYLKSVYHSSSTILPNGRVVYPKRGVRQGDPLSPLLFNMVIGEILSKSHPELGYPMQQGTADALAYADDLIILADTQEVLQIKLKALSTACTQAGLSINLNKSFGIKIVTNKKRKYTVLSPESFTVDENFLKPLSIFDTFSYLGVTFDWKGRIFKDHLSRMKQLLNEVRSAPLKPYQRLEILRTYLIPRFLYALTLQTLHKRSLRHLDQMVRAAVRSWLRLPNDTSVAYFHSPVKLGGLGIQSLSISIPLHQQTRLDKMKSSTNEFLRWSGMVHSPLQKQFLPRIGNDIISDKDMADEAWYKMMADTLDGKHVRHIKESTASSIWLAQKTRMWPRLFIRGSQLRFGVLSTKARRSRGDRPKVNLLCNGGCNALESLSHVLQRCSRTHLARCKRHDRIVQLVQRKLKRRDCKVLTEPRIPTASTFCKPDLLIVNGDNIHVLEVAVCDPERMSITWTNKITRYNQEHVNRSIRNLMQSQGFIVRRIVHSPVIMTYNGLLYKKSGAALRNLSLTRWDLNDICIETIRGSLSVYDNYMMGA